MERLRPNKPFDIVLLVTVVGLVLFGFIMVASASAVMADKFRDDPFYFFKHQLFYGGSVGLLALLVGMYVPYRSWRMLSFPALLASLVLLVLVFVPQLQVAAGGAARWIGIGPITVQPTEVTKLAFILYLAALFETRSAHIRNFKEGVLPFLVIMVIIGILIILQPDLGTLLAIVAIGTAMIYAGGIRLSHLMFLGLGGLGLLAILIKTASYRLNRIMVYLHPEIDPQGIGYQINQALLAVGSGGWWGLGFGRSRQKYQYLPEPAGDSIYAIIAEELGLIRSSFVLGAFAILGWRGFSIAQKSPDIFGRLLAVGLTSWIVIQAFINVGSILGVTPMTGIPLPFISYGGSSLVTMMLAAGILLNISRYARD